MQSNQIPFKIVYSEEDRQPLQQFITNFKYENMTKWQFVAILLLAYEPMYLFIYTLGWSRNGGFHSF